MLEFKKVLPTNELHIQKIQVYRELPDDNKLIFGYIIEDIKGFYFKPYDNTLLSFPVMQEVTQFMEELEAEILYAQITGESNEQEKNPT